ncbi:MAG TPA: hypothetical protein VGF33_10040 [Caulobacteraceae bacterium]
MKVAKKREAREGLEPSWRLFLGAARLPFFIEKARERPSWGSTQLYDLCHDQAGFVVDGSVYSLMQIAQLFADALAPRP